MSVDSGGPELSIRGQSGSFTIKPANGSADEKRSITVSFFSLTEVDATGADTQNNANVENFATTNFVFGTLQNANYRGVDCTSLDSTANLGKGGVLSVRTFFFAESATIVNPGPDNTNEEFSVNAGELKFDIEVKDFPFCEGDGPGPPCFHDTGLALDLAIKIQGSSGGAPIKSNSSDLLYDLGDGMAAQMSSYVARDGIPESLSAGFPALQEEQPMPMVPRHEPEDAVRRTAHRHR